MTAFEKILRNLFLTIVILIAMLLVSSKVLPISTGKPVSRYYQQSYEYMASELM